MKAVALDELFDDSAQFGRYQTFVVLLLFVPASILSGWNAYGMVFLTYTPEFQCADGGSPNYTSLGSNVSFNHSIHDHSIVDDDFDEKCFYRTISNETDEPTNVVACRHWNYDKTHFRATLVTELDLVCSKSIQPKVMLSLLGVAGVLGLATFSYIQDSFGRKPAFLLSLTCYVVGASGSTFAHSLLVFTLIRAFAASQFDVSYNIPYIWSLEFFGPAKRTVVNGILAVGFGIGALFLSVLAYLFPNWRHFGVATSLPFVFCYTYALLIYESPRWLLSQGRIQETSIVIRKMARWSGKRHERHEGEKDELEQRLRLLYTDEDNVKTITTTPVNQLNQPRPRLWHLFRGPNMRMKTILITSVWISNAVTYYSIAYNLENLGGSPFVTFAVQAVMEAPANLLNIVLLNRVGRILPLFTAMIACSVCCFMYVPASYYGVWQGLVLASCAKFAICVSYNIMYQLSGELYPTTLRGVGVGFSCLFGNLGTITMPYIVYSAEAHLTLPMIILGVITFIGALCSAFLPETMGQHMPQTVEEAERYGLVGWNTAVVSHWKRFLKLIRANKDHEANNNNISSTGPTIVQCSID